MSKPKPTPAPKKRANADWEAVERDYRLGRYTLRELAARHPGANHATIDRRAKKEGWTKDLTTAIRQATNAKLIEAETRQACDGARQDATTTVLVAAELNKQVILKHRERVGKAVDVAMRLLAELDATTTHQDELNARFDALASDMTEQQAAAARAELRDFLKLHNRVSSVQRLVDALGKAQTLERQAHSLDDPNKPAEKADRDLDWSAIPESERMAAYLKMVAGG